MGNAYANINFLSLSKNSIVAVPEVVIVLVALFLNANLGSNMRVPEQINYSGLNCEHSIFFWLYS